MRLAPEAIQIVHGGNTVHLRPSLRAAYRLETRFRLKNIIDGMAECNVEIIDAIIAETATDPIEARRLLIGSIDSFGVRHLQSFAVPLTSVLAYSYGIADDPDEDHHAHKRARAGKPVSILDSLASIYQIATGWLGWSAEDALNSTPAQIIAAQDGFIAKLRATHGVGDAGHTPANDIQSLPSDEEVKEGLSKLREIASR
ncbi:MAG: hypothetical protein WBF87_15285 [Mesorhizobium sp.]